jgi:hypothetical protein
VVGRAQNLFGPFRAQRVEVFEEVLNVLIGKFPQRFPALDRARDDLVSSLGAAGSLCI